jgi:hypothetical protein
MAGNLFVGPEAVHHLVHGNLDAAPFQRPIDQVGIVHAPLAVGKNEHRMSANLPELP